MYGQEVWWAARPCVLLSTLELMVRLGSNLIERVNGLYGKILLGLALVGVKEMAFIASDFI